jgi:hypothetical protein
MKGRLLLALLALAGLAALTPTREVSAFPSNCFNNPRLEYRDYEGSALCMGAGDGCTFCSSAGDRGPGSWDVCYFSVRTGDITCYTMM